MTNEDGKDAAAPRLIRTLAGFAAGVFPAYLLARFLVEVLHVTAWVSLVVLVAGGWAGEQWETFRYPRAYRTFFEKRPWEFLGTIASMVALLQLGQKLAPSF